MTKQEIEEYLKLAEEHITKCENDLLYWTSLRDASKLALETKDYE